MKYVIGIDLGTSAVKLILVNKYGKVTQEISKSYPLIQEGPGYSEQDSNIWMDQTIAGLSDLIFISKQSSVDVLSALSK